MARIPSRWLAHGVVLAMLGALAWRLERGPASDGAAGEDPTADDGTRRPRGIGAADARAFRPVIVDPATPPLEWVREDELVERPEEPPPLHELARDPEAMEELMDLLEWSLAHGQGGEAGREMARCAARFEPELEERCSWEVEAVIRRQTEDAGMVVYARAVPTGGGDQPACRAMASCWTQVWAEREVPMPSRVGDEVAFSQPGRGSSWEPGRGGDQTQHYRDRATELQRRVDELEGIAHQPAEVTPVSLAWNALFFQHRVDEAKCMVEVLEGHEGACGT